MASIAPFAHIPFPALPVPPAWFPGHMNKFTRQLPTLLPRTHVILEVRDSRLPLTSINRNLQEELRLWREKQRIHNNPICRHIVLLNKADRVPAWGIPPFLSVMKEKYPGQTFMFTCLREAADCRKLYRMLAEIGREFPHLESMNVLILGMPNVGKSSLLNSLRHLGIKGRTPKAVRTGPQPGLTQALSNRVKIIDSPAAYALDTPGMMLPFLGHGPAGAERGAKLALIAGIKEGLYQSETLAEYLLYKLNVLNPISPTYLSILPSGSSPTTDLYQFLSLVSQRMGMRAVGGDFDYQRAATFFIDWWRKKDGIAETTDATASRGWGFDFQWPAEAGGDLKALMDRGLREFEQHATKEEEEGNMISDAQKEKFVQEEKAREREKRFSGDPDKYRSRRTDAGAGAGGKRRRR